MIPRALVFAATVAALLQPAVVRGDTAGSYANGVSGGQVVDLVQAAMRAAGMSGTPQISMLRSFPACATTPVVNPTDPSWRTVSLGCERPRPWRRAIRTHARGTAAAPITAPDHSPFDGTRSVVLTESLSRGTVLTRDKLALRDVPAIMGDTLYHDLAAVTGRTLKVNLGAGRPVLARHLDRDWMVRKGDPVAISANLGGLVVETAGQALQAGQQGELIEVRNTTSGKVLHAIVAEANKVVVRPKMN